MGTAYPLKGVRPRLISPLQEPTCVAPTGMGMLWSTEYQLQCHPALPVLCTALPLGEGVIGRRTGDVVLISKVLC